MERIQLDKLRIELAEAKIREANITDKYSNNYMLWNKACFKVNKLRSKYNKAVIAYNSKNGTTGFNIY